MKLDFDKEMDALLRNLPDATRERAAAASLTNSTRRERDENARGATLHLDADELSAYAENALPAATRARYVAHLADCATCRRLATNIAMAADVAGALERNNAAERAPAEAATVASGWRARLASFFSPRALLYAAPVLALLVAGTAIFTVMQTYQRGAKQFVRVIPREQAEREEAATAGQLAEPDKAQEPPRAIAVSEPTPGAISKGAPPAAVAPAPSARQTGEPEKAETIARVDKNETDAQRSSALAPVAQPTGPEIVSLPTETRQVQKTADDDAVRVEDRAVATPSTARPPVKETAEVTKTPGREEAREKRVEEVAVTGGNKVANAAPDRTDQTDSRRSGTADAEKQNKRVEGFTASRPAAPKTEIKSAPIGKARRSVPPAMSGGASESSGETRSVAGRQFRRQSGAWVDTAYQASTSLTNVTRGSEHYRALVADEPELRRVAEQLGGEVIVLWKNRAYRIR